MLRAEVLLKKTWTKHEFKHSSLYSISLNWEEVSVPNSGWSGGECERMALHGNSNLSWMKTRISSTMKLIPSNFFRESIDDDKEENNESTFSSIKCCSNIFFLSCIFSQFRALCLPQLHHLSDPTSNMTKTIVDTIDDKHICKYGFERRENFFFVFILFCWKDWNVCVLQTLVR